MIKNNNGKEKAGEVEIEEEEGCRRKIKRWKGLKERERERRINNNNKKKEGVFVKEGKGLWGREEKTICFLLFFFSDYNYDYNFSYNCNSD